jgi:UDP-N-acetylmuramate--alanine ligase
MKYHLIGDQGISMRGIAEYLKSEGNIVTGSDLKGRSHSRANITKDIDVVVRSSAINPGSLGWQEVEEAQKLGITVFKRSEFLGELTRKKRLIAVSGMHGKTTITTMAGLLLIEAGLDPTVLVGERVGQFDDHVIRIGKSDWFVAEVCEYDRSFLDFWPEILILSNIDKEHLDTYPGGIPEIVEAFREYVSHVKKDGLIIACCDDENIKKAIDSSKTPAQVIYYGKTSEKYNKLEFELAIPGEHNKLNALAVIALADYLKIDRITVEKVLKNFQGAKRRFEYKGSFNGAGIYDDYGHHPTEIKATIEAAKDRFSDKKLFVVFWPHQYKRIKPLLREFGEAFDKADEIILMPIYLVPGRDEILDVSTDDIVEIVKTRGKDVKKYDTEDEIVEYLKGKLNKDAVLLTIGIPPVYKIAEALAGEE